MCPIFEDALFLCQVANLEQIGEALLGGLVIRLEVSSMERALLDLSKMP